MDAFPLSLPAASAAAPSAHASRADRGAAAKEAAAATAAAATPAPAPSASLRLSAPLPPYMADATPPYQPPSTSESREDRKRKLHAMFARMPLKKHEWLFGEPVVEEDAPDYGEVIAHPVNFKALRVWIDSGALWASSQLAVGARMIATNCRTYNHEDEKIQRVATDWEAQAEKTFKAGLEAEAADEKAAGRYGGAAPGAGLDRVWVSVPKWEGVISDSEDDEGAPGGGKDAGGAPATGGRSARKAATIAKDRVTATLASTPAAGSGHSKTAGAANAHAQSSAAASAASIAAAAPTPAPAGPAAASATTSRKRRRGDEDGSITGGDGDSVVTGTGADSESVAAAAGDDKESVSAARGGAKSAKKAPAPPAAAASKGEAAAKAATPAPAPAPAAAPPSKKKK